MVSSITFGSSLVVNPPHRGSLLNRYGTGIVKAPPSATTPTLSFTSLSLFPPESSHWIATIDADIANIPDNEFAPIFMGGILVMFGGVLSAVILGFILEKGDLYANVVADSYMQQGNDEEFWRGLSEEERIQGTEILRQLEAKNGKKLPTSAIPETILSGSTSNNEIAPSPAATAVTSRKEMDMFSDYE